MCPGGLASAAAAIAGGEVIRVKASAAVPAALRIHSGATGAVATLRVLSTAWAGAVATPTAWAGAVATLRVHAALLRVLVHTRTAHRSAGAEAAALLVIRTRRCE